jgi:hypothetical protein
MKTKIGMMVLAGVGSLPWILQNLPRLGGDLDIYSTGESTLEGSVISDGCGELRLTRLSDKHDCLLIQGHFTLKPGERFRLQGK